MLIVILIALCLGAGLTSGVFFAFSTFVLKALAQLPAAEGIRAMQRINVVVLNPLFLGCFLGTAALAGACIVNWVFPWAGEGSPWSLAAGLSYLIGCFGVTAAFNVPRNERLAPMTSESDEAAVYWPVYLREWGLWNHVRTAASLVAAACAAAALVL